jgi:hypothetical protein
LEVSAVGIPANPNALALGLKAGAVDRDDLKAALDLLQRIASPRRHRSIPEQFLGLIREAGEVLGI